MNSPTDSIALVTGAASGIGRATALLLAKRNTTVVVSDVNTEGGQQTVEQIKGADGDAQFVRCDVGRPDDVERLFDSITDAYGRLDIAVNNAGIEGEQASTADCTLENWTRVIDINLRGTWLCMKHEVPLMRAGGRGWIVNVASIAGLIGFRGLPAYVASKHGMIGLTKNAALEYARDGIRVNAVCPGAIRTPMIDRVTHGDSDFERSLIDAHPIGRMGEPEEIAALICWLSSDEASFITGQAIAADGGYVAQ